MAIVHNLSSIIDNLSGFDPVAGEVDGTTIGKSYILWQVVQGLIAFDTNFAIITSGSPTPTFLQAEAGTVTSAPAKSATGTVNQAAIRLYKTNDPGLSQSPQSAMIYEFNTTSDITSTNNNLFALAIRFKISGGTTYAPTTVGVLTIGDNGAAGSQNNCIVSLGFSGGSTTTMNQIPKILFIKTSDSLLIMSIRKVDGICLGYGYLINPTWTAYKHNVGASTEGLHLRMTAFINMNGGGSGIEGVVQTFTGQLAVGIPAGISLLTSAGQLPLNQFTYSSANYYMTNKLRIGLNDGANYKAVSNEIEGVILLNSGVAGAAGTIISLNSVYYVWGNVVNDGRDSYRILFRLTA